MALYINQINKRRAAEQAAMAEVNEKTTRRLGLQEKKRVVPQNDESALRQVLEALGITDYELEDDEMLSPEEQLTGILRPRGIMIRDIRGVSASDPCSAVPRTDGSWHWPRQRRDWAISTVNRMVPSDRWAVGKWPVS